MASALGSPANACDARRILPAALSFPLPVAPLRCHRLIGPPASGKSTLVRALAPLFSGPDQPPALVRSTDAIRAEPDPVDTTT